MPKQVEQRVPEEAISADDLIAVLERALDAEAQLPTPEDAGFVPNAIRDFLTFVQAHGGFEVPVDQTRNEPVHYGSLMAGLVLGAVAAAPALLKQERERIEELELLLEAAQKDPTSIERATEFAAGLEKGREQERERIREALERWLADAEMRREEARGDAARAQAVAYAATLGEVVRLLNTLEDAE